MKMNPEGAVVKCSPILEPNMKKERSNSAEFDFGKDTVPFVTIKAILHESGRIKRVRKGILNLDQSNCVVLDLCTNNEPSSEDVSERLDTGVIKSEIYDARSRV